jgi:membrane protein YdbS with pleckstrin-like domain
MERQPRGARGTIEHPNSALRLRLVLAVFGVLVCAAGAAVLWRTGWWGWVFVALGAVAAVDLVVIVRRLRGPARPG